ncbi:hypothetical protein DNU06_07430 [Putridiphycobacter roseus]|uniref:Uncharacterized protein n=1 Tax=Putridiphycobacter roseus TaxID=2219161 RepID=A0A2W1NEX5_9FLAO|nr:hypothetical protein [Putridiphycobacter roseus]PZE17653.1 hypothetical protein DNU06_07430 [Putridiphycobacter roseus]
MKKYAFFLLVAILFSFTSGHQSTGRHIIQFKIKTITTYEEAAKIDAFMGTQDGILASRTDYIGETYFCFTDKNKDLTETNFKNWMKELGYQIGCFHKTVDGEGKAVNMDELEKCAE